MVSYSVATVGILMDNVTLCFPVAVNPCDGTACSHLCLLSAVASAGYVCACPDGAVLEDNGVDCNCKYSAVLMWIPFYTIPISL